MYKINFKKPIHIHFIGIGGISMSGLAEILLKEGFTVSGSDSRKSPLTQQLEDKGARVFYGQKAGNIIDEIECVVYTAAISRDNPELIEAVARKIPMLTRAELLGQLMKNYKNPIAVSGTHGKTTTTSMISHILLEGNLDPTISVGGILQAIGGNIRVGNSDTFITEACEYTNSFLDFYPRISVILNIEEDHLDFFKDLEDIRHSFHQFASLLPPTELLLSIQIYRTMKRSATGFTAASSLTEVRRIPTTARRISVTTIKAASLLTCFGTELLQNTLFFLSPETTMFPMRLLLSQLQSCLAFQPI